MPELCHCGQPLHYSDPAFQTYVESLINRLGAYVPVKADGRTWRVPRHYLALHGLAGWKLPSYGFEEITEAPKK